MTLIVFQ